MWLFTKQGHLALAQHPTENDCLIVQAQQRGDMDHFVKLLSEVSGHRHEVLLSGDSGYQCTVVAGKAIAAQAIARIVAGIEYTRFTQSAHFDFGREPGFLAMMSPCGLHVARVKPE